MKQTLLLKGQLLQRHPFDHIGQVPHLSRIEQREWLVPAGIAGDNSLFLLVMSKWLSSSVLEIFLP